MDPTSWSAYSQHFSRLGVNHPPPQPPMNDLPHPTYGNHFLLPQGNHNDPASFNANLFAANYDASLFAKQFPHQPGLFKARENDFNDLRTGFGMAYGRNSEGSNGLGGGIPSGHMFPNSMPPGSWRHSGMIPNSCGPFGVLPHETVLQRSHLVSQEREKKQSRSARAFVEQDLGRGYRSILTSPARPPSSYVDGGNTSHSSLQNDPYFSSMSDNYYSSCSKNDFSAYSSYCSNVQSGVQRAPPYCYPQSFANFESGEKQEASPATNPSANANFTNFVPNSALNGNHDQISRQSVITSNINNNAAMFNPNESHPQNHSYNMREPYPYPVNPANARNETNGSRLHVNNSHHSSAGQNLYPPINTPIPASTPAHTTPPSSTIGQAYVPTPLPMSHDSGCSSVNSQSVMYHSPSNDGCYSTESGSPAKQDLSQHSSPSIYSIDSSNLSMNSATYGEQHHVRSDTNYNTVNGGSDVQDNTNDSTKVVEENLALAASDSRKDVPHLPQVLPIDMVKLNKDAGYQGEARFEGRPKHLDPLPSRPERVVNAKEGFVFASESPPPALDFTAKDKVKSKRGRKRKCEATVSPSPLNCTYSHLQNSESQLASPASAVDAEEVGIPMSDAVMQETSSPAAVVEDSKPVSNASPHPVDLSHSVKVASEKPDSPPPEKKEAKEALPDLNYENDKSTGGKWSLTKQDVTEPESKEVVAVDAPENLTTQNCLEKEAPKSRSPLCRTPPMDDLSDESKKLCNSIEEDLGFLAGLSSDPDVEDSVSKGSFSEKKSKKDKGFLQSFLTFLESSNEPTASVSNLEVKDEKKEGDDSSSKKEENLKKEDSSPIEDPKSDGDKTIIDESEDKDNFDEAPSLDPTLFGCSTLQKEMVVPNPEAPSFSSDEDENSTQGIFDSVAMAIQRLCEDNEEEANKSSGSKSKKEMPVLTSVDEEMPEVKDKPAEACSIKRACVMRGRRGKRRRKHHLLVIKVKRDNKDPDSAKVDVPKTKRTRTKDVEIVKTLPSSQRRTLMRKCKEKGARKKNARATKRKSRNSTKRKYDTDEKEEPINIVIDDDVSTISKEQDTIKEEVSKPPPLSIPIPSSSADTPALPPATASTTPIPTQPSPPQPSNSIESPQPSTHLSSQPSTSLPQPTQPPPVRPKKKKVNKTIGYRTRKRRRKPRKPPADLPQPVADLQLPVDPPKEAVVGADAKEVSSKLSGEGGWNTETHFKTGDFVISIDSRDVERPPMWRIESKNVLQLFEALENGEGSYSILYRNTSSYSRWSPSSKHKYLKKPVKIIKSDDDTVIVELIHHSETVADKDISGSCDYTVHPQRENFEVYLQTLVSHSLDPDFIPEIVKEKDEYFLSHLQVIEEIATQKKEALPSRERWSPQLSDAIQTYPHFTVTKSTKNKDNLCQVCQATPVQCSVQFEGRVYDPMTLVSKGEDETSHTSVFGTQLCGTCLQAATLYSRLHHHKYHFFQLGCKKVRDVKKGQDKDSHTILEECLQDAEWMTQMFQEMLEMWNASDKCR